MVWKLRELVENYTVISLSVFPECYFFQSRNLKKVLLERYFGVDNFWICHLITLAMPLWTCKQTNSTAFMVDNINFKCKISLIRFQRALFSKGVLLRRKNDFSNFLILKVFYLRGREVWDLRGYNWRALVCSWTVYDCFADSVKRKNFVLKNTTRAFKSWKIRTSWIAIIVWNLLVLKTRCCF